MEWVAPTTHEHRERRSDRPRRSQGRERNGSETGARQERGRSEAGAAPTTRTPTDAREGGEGEDEFEEGARRNTAARGGRGVVTPRARGDPVCWVRGPPSLALRKPT